jgi:hypothetical protein
VIQELFVYPQVTYSESQGQIGTREWQLDANDDLQRFLYIVSNSHWPGRKGCIPIQIQCGGVWDGVVLKREIDNYRSYQTLGDLPKYGKYKVVAQYALHRMNNSWPASFGPKPYHPPGTTLNVEEKGAGQYVLASPAGMRGASPDVLLCDQGSEGISPGFFGRVVLPVAEYHLVCGRLTKAQLDAIFTRNHWDNYLGAVNYTDPLDGKDGLLAAPHGTLLFDGYNLKENYTCHSDQPLRYSLSAVLKRRVVLGDSPGNDDDGTPIAPPYLQSDGVPVGWNHDYVNIRSEDKRWGWKFIKIWQDNECVPRYRNLDFRYLFADVEPELFEVHKPGWDVYDDDTEPYPEILCDNALCVPQ